MRGSSLRLIIGPVLFLLLLAEARLQTTADVKKEEAEEDSEEDTSQFLYDNDDAAPIIEYKTEEGDQDDNPDFIYGANNGPRVVEFYAPWCPHCQHFRDHFVEFARQVRR